MPRTIADFDSFQFDQINPIGYEGEIEKKQYENTIVNLRYVFELLHNANKTVMHQSIPPSLGGPLNGFIEEFINHINTIESSNPSIEVSKFLRNKTNAILAINTWAINLFNISSDNKFLQTCNTIINLGKEQIDIETSAIEKARLDLEVLINETKKNQNRVHDILNELQEKASKTTVSKYAKVFESEAAEHKKNSKKWLMWGIISSIALALFIICSYAFNWFSVISEDENARNRIFYSIPALVTKVIIISLGLYLISFCFKQYSVNKHLETTNKHRQNALNSYLLFTESIIGDDHNSRNNLMVQVAKAIYEHTSTGYLSSKQQETNNSGIIEFTKFISDQK